MATVYDRTEIYDLFENEERYQAIKKHWEKVLEGKNITSLIDVSIGTGNLTLPLIELGVQLDGSDLSESMLQRCREKAELKDAKMELTACDFRNLKKTILKKYDCVASTGNSLPYVDNDEILNVLEQMDGLVNENGYLYFDMRNWDKILKERNRFFLYDPQFKDNTRINLTQVWDYLPDGSMTFNMLYTFEKDQQVIQKEYFEEHYYPVAQDILINKLKELGYEDIQIMCHPAYFENVNMEKVNWYCMIARKGKQI